MFDRQDRKIGGSAAGGLGQYEIRTDDGELMVDRGEVIVGGVTPRGEAPAALDDADFSRPYELVPRAWAVVEGVDRMLVRQAARPLAGRGHFAMTSPWPDAVAEMAGA